MRTISRANNGRVLVVGLVTAALLTLTTAPAFAHGAGESTDARVLVLEALSYMANQPTGFEDMAAEKIRDANDATEVEGVNMAMVRDAMIQMAAGNVSQSRTDLQTSMQPMGERATGTETGTTLMEDPLEPNTTWTTGQWLLAIGSLSIVLLGVVLAYLWRPEKTVHELRDEMLSKHLATAEAAR